MTKKSIIYPFLVLMTIGSVSGGELKMSTNQSIITIDENLNEWVLVKEDAGIKVYFMKVEEEGMCQIKIKFENTLSQEVKFYWSINKGDKTIIDAKQTIISANNSEIFIDYLTPIKFSSKDYFNEFIISISK
ncbi:MAG: hypothetical protein OQJ96_10760 [Flavobacteriales bacterium]|jgi:hypothetical protein|nr:hypothetical protein [Flavobacteriales bacterium]MCW8914176.1 hypothetical protein [Flavobacteriales bacterium]MCW8938317.1 hypothetical protein [Flavobacteriales bacterium]MCW8940626.1 hypothetical protein [Flavobacteriales bacterium]MCW8969559.1 hypothetical protein [Flavobacteriales bacterium]